MAQLDNQPICVVHRDECGWTNFYLSGDVLFFNVDECVPHDRVYQITHQTPREAITALLGDSSIGSRLDSRHPAIERRIRRALQGMIHLELLDNPPGDPDDVAASSPLALGPMPLEPSVATQHAIDGSSSDRSPGEKDLMATLAGEGQVRMPAAAIETVVALLAHSPPERQRTLMAELKASLAQQHDAAVRCRKAIDQIIRVGEGVGPE